jgi:hypothetical protein
MDQFPKWHLSWIIHKIFYIPIITPYDIAILPTKYVSDFKIVIFCLAIGQGEYVILDSL